MIDFVVGMIVVVLALAAGRIVPQVAVRRTLGRLLAVAALVMRYAV